MEGEGVGSMEVGGGWMSRACPAVLVVMCVWIPGVQVTTVWNERRACGNGGRQACGGGVGGRLRGGSDGVGVTHNGLLG